MSPSVFICLGASRHFLYWGAPLACVLRTYIRRMHIIIVITVLSYIYILGTKVISYILNLI